MKLRLFAGLPLVLALGGCVSYGYVDDGGGYYSGGPSSEYVYVPDYGGYGYGYGVYGYGSPYYSYRYTPGWSFGLGYGSAYGYYGYGGYPWYSGGGYYRPPPHYPRPPVHRPPPGNAGGAPDRPSNRPLDRAPWRNLQQIREEDGRQRYPERPARPGTADRAEGTWQGTPPLRQRPVTGPRPSYPAGRESGPVYRPPVDARVSGADRPAARQVQPRVMQRPSPRQDVSGGSQKHHRNATRDTDEP